MHIDGQPLSRGCCFVFYRLLVVDRLPLPLSSPPPAAHIQRTSEQEQYGHQNDENRRRLRGLPGTHPFPLLPSRRRGGVQFNTALSSLPLSLSVSVARRLVNRRTLRGERGANNNPTLGFAVCTTISARYLMFVWLCALAWFVQQRCASV